MISAGKFIIYLPAFVLSFEKFYILFIMMNKNDKFGRLYTTTRK